MRVVGHKRCFTDFGLWIRDNLRDSANVSGGGMNVSNIDYVLYDYQQKRFMLLEEKTNGGIIYNGQKTIFQMLDKLLLENKKISCGYEYWGFYVLWFPSGHTLPCNGMKLNWKKIEKRELIDHLNFERKFCESLYTEYPRS